VKKNTINNNNISGIQTAFSNDNLYEDNVINNNGGTGILLQIDTNDEIKSNEINKNFQLISL
jgi:parallel beta-helix repeat protein